LARLIRTDRASLRRAVSRKSLISLICFGAVSRKSLISLIYFGCREKGQIIANESANATIILPAFERAANLALVA
jgi:hypothetical protein